MSLANSPIIRIVGIFLGLLLAYMAVGEDVMRAVRPRARNYRLKYARFIKRPVIVPFLIFVTLGVLMRDWLLTPFLVFVALLIAYVRIRQLVRREEIITPRQVLQLALAFRGNYQLQPAVFASLQDSVSKAEGPLKDLLHVTVESFFLTASAPRAFEEFRKRTDNVMLHQFIYILEMSESASNESTTEALDSFVARLRRREDLQNQVETNLTGITGQTIFIQVVAIGVAFLIALISNPPLREMYVTGLGRFLYMGLLSVILAASYYIERRIDSLKEQVV